MPLNGESGEHQARGGARRQAGWPLKKGSHLEGREDGHILAQGGDPVIVPEILFGPAREKEVRETAGIQREPGSRPRGCPQSSFTAPCPSPSGLQQTLGGP